MRYRAQFQFLVVVGLNVAQFETIFEHRPSRPSRFIRLGQTGIGAERHRDLRKAGAALE